jgi:hypothetical protein
LQLSDTDFDRALVERDVEVELEPRRVLKVGTAGDLIVLKLISTRAVDYYDLETIIRFQKDIPDEKYIFNRYLPKDPGVKMNGKKGHTIIRTRPNSCCIEASI